ncbi:hypothetical protein V2J09_016294 [Rumex salicifolius]
MDSQLHSVRQPYDGSDKRGVTALRRRDSPSRGDLRLELDAAHDSSSAMAVDPPVVDPPAADPRADDDDIDMDALEAVFRTSYVDGDQGAGGIRDIPTFTTGNDSVVPEEHGVGMKTGEQDVLQERDARRLLHVEGVGMGAHEAEGEDEEDEGAEPVHLKKVLKPYTRSPHFNKIHCWNRDDPDSWWPLAQRSKTTQKVKLKYASLVLNLDHVMWMPWGELGFNNRPTGEAVHPDRVVPHPPTASIAVRRIVIGQMRRMLMMREGLLEDVTATMIQWIEIFQGTTMPIEDPILRTSQIFRDSVIEQGSGSGMPHDEA